MSKYVTSRGSNITKAERDAGLVVSGPIYREGTSTRATITGITREVAQDLREYFQHERDEELGRWRSKKHPDWTAVLDAPVDSVNFRHENGIQAFDVDNRERRYTQWDAELREVAAEYFAAHPVSKPWHKAKPGEVWDIRVADQINSTRTFVVKTSKDELLFRSVRGRIEIEDEDIAEANRVLAAPNV